MTRSEVRVCSFDELDAYTAYRLWQLRETVFVVEQSCPYPELDGRDLEPTARHLWVEHEGAPIAYLRILEDSGVPRIGRVLVARPWRGKGLAEVLMRSALEQVGPRPSVLDAQSYLASWYVRFGYAQTGPEFLDDGVAHLPMRREAR
ncbi:MAG TPA: GNAT family N-acetyltransferase [Nocardioidaceae bacterium]|nr:GNAT family N-acetyltransferase [Nocardioidaceae bacterium]